MRHFLGVPSENRLFTADSIFRRDSYGETISTSFVESTINEVVAKRMVKKQQMQWTHEGVHYLLQTRTAVLNDELHGHFEHWHPGLKIEKKAE